MISAGLLLSMRKAARRRSATAPWGKTLGCPGGGLDCAPQERGLVRKFSKRRLYILHQPTKGTLSQAKAPAARMGGLPRWLKGRRSLPVGGQAGTGRDELRQKRDSSPADFPESFLPPSTFDF